MHLSVFSDKSGTTVAVYASVMISYVVLLINIERNTFDDSSYT